MKCGIVLLSCAIAVLGATSNVSTSNQDKLNALIDQEWEYELHEYPEKATSIGDNRFNDRIMDYSAAAYQKRAAHDRVLLAELKKIASEGLSETDKLNLGLMLQRVEVDVAGERFKGWEMRPIK